MYYSEEATVGNTDRHLVVCLWSRNHIPLIQYLITWLSRKRLTRLVLLIPVAMPYQVCDLRKGQWVTLSLGPLYNFTLEDYGKRPGNHWGDNVADRRRKTSGSLGHFKIFSQL